MKSLLLWLLLLGTSRVGTDAFLDSFFGSSDTYNTPSAPLDHPPSHVHGHRTDEESDNRAHHHTHHNHDGMDGDVFDQPSHAHHGHKHPDMDDNGDIPSAGTQHRPRHLLHADPHNYGHRHHGHHHPPHHNHTHNHTHFHHNRPHLHNHTHNHTHFHHNHPHLHNHTHPLPPHQHGRHPHHRHRGPHRARDRRIFEFRDPMSLDERRQRNVWDSIIRRPNNGFMSAGSQNDRRDSHDTPDDPTPNTNPDIPSNPRHIFGMFPARRPPFPPYAPDTLHQRPQVAIPHISPSRHHEDPYHYGPRYHPRPLQTSFFFPPRHLQPPPPPPTTPRRRCPMLYSSVGGRCIAIFSIARMSWNDAKQFCDGIFGELFSFSRPQEYRDLVVYLRTRGLSTPLWVGGHETSSGWKWLDQRIMPLGTPYWAVRHAPPLSGGRSMQCPSKRSDDSLWCAAVEAEDYYYLSDSECDARKAPMCVLRDDAEVVVAQGETNYFYPALDPGFCQNWMVTGRDEDGKEVFGEETDESSEESSSDDEEMSDGESSESQGSSEESEEEEEGQEDEEKGTEENEEEGAENENDQEEGKGTPSTPTPGEDNDVEEGDSTDNDQDTSSGSGSGDEMPGDDEDMEEEGSGSSSSNQPTDDDYYVMYDRDDYAAMESIFDTQ